MVDVTVNYPAIVVAGISNIVLGTLWYGPVFGKEWMRVMGFTKEDIEKEKKKGMGKTYAVAFVSALVMACVLAHVVALLGAETVMDGARAGFWVWLGFVATVLTGSVLWEGRPWKLYALNAGYYLAALVAQGMILAAWA